MRESEEDIGRKINFTLAFNRTSPPPFIRRIEREITTQMLENELPVLKTHLYRREAYNAMFMERTSLFELNPAKVNGLEAAIDNAIQLTEEVLDVLKSNATERAA